MFWELLEASCMIASQVFLKFWYGERNTENTMSHLYFNEESDYSEEKSLSPHHFPP